MSLPADDENAAPGHSGAVDPASLLVLSQTPGDAAALWSAWGHRPKVRISLSPAWRFVPGGVRLGARDGRDLAGLLRIVRQWGAAVAFIDTAAPVAIDAAAAVAAARQGLTVVVTGPRGALRAACRRAGVAVVAAARPADRERRTRAPGGRSRANRADAGRAAPDPNGIGEKDGRLQA